MTYLYVLLGATTALGAHATGITLDMILLVLMVCAFYLSRLLDLAERRPRSTSRCRPRVSST